MTITIPSTSAASATTPVLAPDGLPLRSPGAQGVLATWIPDRVQLGPELDTLWLQDPRDEIQVVRDGGLLCANTNVLLDPTSVRASLVAGPYTRKGSKITTAYGVEVWPLEGCLSLDQFTIEGYVMSLGADIAAQTGTNYVFRVGGTSGTGYDLYLTQSGASAGSCSFTATFSILDAQITGGTTRTLTATVTLVTGDVPADTWKKWALTFNAADAANKLKLIFGNAAKTAMSSVAASPPFARRAMSSDPFLGTGLAIAGNGASAGLSKLAVAEMRVSRYARVYNTSPARVSFPKITVDTATELGAWPSKIAGVVGQHSDWTEDDTESGAAILARRAAQMDAWRDIGGTMVRVAEFNHLAILDDASDPITTADITFTKWDAHIERWLSRGIDFCMHWGYTPTLLQSTPGQQKSKPTSNARMAEYVSAVITHTKAYIAANHPDHVGSSPAHISAWNEPSQVGFWSGTKAEFLAMDVAVTTKLQTDHPDMVLGGLDEGYGLSSAGSPDGECEYHRSLIASRAANGLRCDAIGIHAYNGNLMYMLMSIEDMRAQLDANGFTTSKIRVTEWNYSIGYPQQETQPLNVGFNDRRLVTAFNAGYAHAALAAMVNAGVDLATVYRLGANTIYANFALLDTADPVRPFPIFAAFQEFLRHAGTRVTTSSNWPSLHHSCTVDDDGRIVLTYSHLRPWRWRDDRVKFYVEWPDDLPASFTWKHRQIDNSLDADGRAVVVGAGDESNLPTGVEIGAVGMGSIEITT